MSIVTKRFFGLITSRLALALMLLTMAADVLAQLGSFSRVTSPNGRTVLEIRQGVHPANSGLLFTAVITAGPVSGSTSLMLQQALTRDIFNPAAPAAGWTVVRSSISAFSLGGGCGRSNLLDFPFINGTRPEILRITGTTQQVITLNVAGNNDQYDSIDCVTGADGRVVYMLTNRTRSKLELRREQGGMLVLVRDNFGAVATPFRGGQRPSMQRFRRPVGVAPIASLLPKAALGDPLEDYIALLFETIGPGVLLLTSETIADLALLDAIGICPLAQRLDPLGFLFVLESAISQFAAIARVNSQLFIFRFLLGVGGCTLQPAEPIGSSAPFGLFNWAGVAVRESAPGPLFHTTVIAPGTVFTFGGGMQQIKANPFGTRGGAITSCPMSGSELESAQLATGVGPIASQVQHSVIPIDLQEQIFVSGVEDFWGATRYCGPVQ